MYRIGIGYDTHQLAPHKKLILGGVLVPHPKGFIAHSDGDVLLHALIDALIGATGGIDGKKDIGAFFPDSNPAYKNADSQNLLKIIWNLLKKKFAVVNIDAVLLCQKPKLAPHLQAMEKNISNILHCSAIHVKATTTEQMNAEGEEKCISAQVVCLLKMLSA